ncbi:Ig-like domain-containing protein [Acinetobacter junii]|uniref:Ig-like domain-containing protein n=1 Tax=Acinetobacter junii TaxID=40215 RepID=UPI0035F8C48D
MANDTDADGNPLTITAINGVTLTPGTDKSTPERCEHRCQGNISFTPNAGFTGQKASATASAMAKAAAQLRLKPSTFQQHPTRHLSQAMTRTTPHSTRQ